MTQKETIWNKEDEENMNNVLYILNQLKDTSYYKEDNISERTINWLKSIKDRLCSNNEYDKDMLGAILYCIKNNRPLENEHITWIERNVGIRNEYGDVVVLSKCFKTLYWTLDIMIKEYSKMDGFNVIVNKLKRIKEKIGYIDTL